MLHRSQPYCQFPPTSEKLVTGKGGKKKENKLCKGIPAGSFSFASVVLLVESVNSRRNGYGQGHDTYNGFGIHDTL